MKNRLAIIGIAVLLICVGLSGCNEITNSFPSDKDRFVGTWKSGSGISSIVITFFSDGTGSLSGGSATWEIKDGKLVIYWLGGEVTFTYDYYFSNHDKTLTLTDVGSGKTTEYAKQ